MNISRLKLPRKIRTAQAQLENERYCKKKSVRHKYTVHHHGKETDWKQVTNLNSLENS